VRTRWRYVSYISAQGKAEFVVLDVDREASLPAYLAWVRAEGTPLDP
jgi:hypothetical protein